MVFRGSSSEQGAAPVVAVLLIVALTVLLSVSIAPFILDRVAVDGESYGTEITFQEARNGTVDVQAVEMGTSETMYVTTEYFTRTITETGDSVSVYPGEGEITIIAQRDDENVTVQTYTPRYGPDSLLLAHTGPNRAASPGSSVTLDASGSLGDISSYEWDFDGDGSTDATGEVITTTFPTPAVYNVELTVTNTAGREDTETVRIISADITVANDGSADYLSIQNGVNAASPGAAVYVNNTGTPYAEYVTVYTDAVTLFSDRYATLDGTTLSGTAAGLRIADDDVTVRGLHVTGYDDTGIRVEEDDVTLEDVYLAKSGDSGSSAAALYVRRGADRVVINNSRIVSNHACGIQAGVIYEDSGGPDDLRISNSRITGNAGHGVCIYDSAVRPEISNSELSFNNASGAYIGDADDVVLRNSKLVKNSAGASTDVGAVVVYSTQQATLRNNQITENAFHGLVVEEGHNVLIDSSSVYNNAGSGLDSHSGTRDLEVRDSSMSYNGQYGMHYRYTNYITVQGTQVTYNGEDGVRIQTDSGTVDADIHDSHLLNNSDYDVNVEWQSEDVTATHNWWGQSWGPDSGQTNGPVDTSNPCSTATC